MSNANLSACSMSELKAIAQYHGTAPTGDKRSKQSWIDAIELFQANAEIVATAFVNELADEEDTSDIDTWDAPTTIPDAAMEEISHQADIKASKAIKSLSSLIKLELGESALEQIATEAIEESNPALAPKKALNRKSGAVLISGAIVCILILVFRAAFGGVAVALKLGVYIVRLFGKYDPSLDLGYQLQLFRSVRHFEFN